MFNCFYDIKLFFLCVKLKHDEEFSMSVYTAAPVRNLKFIHFEQYRLSQALSAEAIDLSSNGVAKWFI